MSNNRNLKRYLIVTLIVVLVFTVGLSFAYFTVDIIGIASTDVTVDIAEQATLTFNKTDDLEIGASLSNFALNGVNLSDTTTTSATLTSDGAQTESYYVYFNISENDFEYTTDDDTAELILVIKKPDGSYVTELDGYTFASVDEFTGIDITEETGLIEIANQYEISTTSIETTVTDEWEFTLYFINLETNQNANTGKTFDSEILMQKDEKEIFSNGTLAYKIVVDNAQDAEQTVLSANEAVQYIESKETPNFATIADTDEGMFATTDNYGTSYYYRGAVEDNYVKFAEMLWRIIRIDGEGNIKLMLYNQDDEASSYFPLLENNCFDCQYNPSSSLNYNSATSAGNIRYEVEIWSEEYLSYYRDYIVTTNYCDDLTYYSERSSLYYGAYTRIRTNNSPSLLCDSTINGIYEYEYSVGLISADEISFAGGAYGSSNVNLEYYLYTGYDYWSISSSNYYNYEIAEKAYFAVLTSGVFTHAYTNNYYAVFPTISLSSKVLFLEGNGTIDKPYKIIEN